MSAPWLQELFLDPIVESRRVGVRFGEVVVSPWLLPTAGEDEDGPERTRRQLDEVFDLMDETLQRANGGRGDVVRVVVYLRHIEERPLLNEAWAARLPDPMERPPHKYVPAVLPEGVNVALGVLALLASERRVLEIEGLVHGDPMSIGVRSGNVVTSSRLFAAEADLGAQFEVLVGHARTLLGVAGGSLADLTQATFYVGSAEIGDDVAARAVELGAGEGEVKVHIREADLGSGNGYPRLEILGLLERSEGS